MRSLYEYLLESSIYDVNYESMRRLCTKKARKTLSAWKKIMDKLATELGGKLSPNTGNEYWNPNKVSTTYGIKKHPNDITNDTYSVNEWIRHYRWSFSGEAEQEIDVDAIADKLNDFIHRELKWDDFDIRATVHGKRIADMKNWCGYHSSEIEMIPMNPGETREIQIDQNMIRKYGDDDVFVLLGSILDLGYNENKKMWYLDFPIWIHVMIPDSEVISK